MKHPSSPVPSGGKDSHHRAKQLQRKLARGAVASGEGRVRECEIESVCVRVLCVRMNQLAGGAVASGEWRVREREKERDQFLFFMKESVCVRVCLCVCASLLEELLPRVKVV